MKGEEEKRKGGITTSRPKNVGQRTEKKEKRDLKLPFLVRLENKEGRREEER